MHFDMIVTNGPFRGQGSTHLGYIYQFDNLRKEVTDGR